MADSVETPVAAVSPYLKQVRIRDYAPLRDATVSFKPGLNIIIGENGVGKTRFLNLTSQLANRFGTPKIGVGCELLLSYDQDIKVCYQEISASENALSSFQVDELAAIETKVYYGAKESSSDDGLFEALWNVGLGYSLYEVVLAKHGTPIHQIPLVDLPITLTFGKAFAMRIEPESDVISFANWPLLARSILGTIRISARYWRSQQFHKTDTSLSAIDVRVEVERITNSYLEILNPLLAKYSSIELVRLSNTYQIYNNTSQQEILVKGLVFEYFLTGSWLPFEALSDGTKRMLYLISQLIMPTADQASPSVPIFFSTQPRIIFLEEPELGIHHAQLHKLLYLIREVSIDNQVILTTHAPQVLDMLSADELDRITICSLDPEKGTQFHKLTEEKQEQARVYMKEVGFLSDYWRYSYLEETAAE